MPRTFLVLSLGIDSNSIFSGFAKNANKHFWLLGILNVTTKSRLSSLILITAPKMPNLSLIPLKPSCHPKHDMRDAVFKYAIAHLNKQ